MGNPFIHDESDISSRMIWNFQNAKNQCSIGKISSININPISVNIQPLIKYYDVISGWEDLPILNNIPIAKLQTNFYSIKSPVNVGDIGLLLWFDREVYTCLQTKGIEVTIPDSGSLSDINACIFIPLVQPFSSEVSDQLKSQGVDIISNYQGSPISLLTQILTLLNSLLTFSTALSTASNFGQINVASSTLIASINTLITNLTNFKGLQI